MSDPAESGGRDLPTDEDLQRFWNSNLGRSIERGRSDPADVFQVSEEHPSGATVGVMLSRNPAQDRRGSLGQLYERIADPGRPFPFDREFAIKRWELLAWLDGRRPDYRPSLIERQVILPAYQERLRREAEASRGGNPPLQEPEVDALKTQKNLDRPTIKSLLVHVIGYSEHGKSYGLPPNKHPGLAHVWRPMRYALLKRKFGGESDKETLENWLDYLEFEKGLKRADVLERRLDDWQALLELSPPLEPEQTENTRPSVGLVLDGLANLLNHGAKLRAADRVSAAILELFNSDRETYGVWAQEQWAKHCKCSKKTVAAAPAWAEIMAWREQNKQSRKVELVSPETGKKFILRESL